MNMFGKSTFSSPASSSNTYTWNSSAVNANKDIEVSSAPDDTISSLSWSPTGMFFVAGSWNNSVRCWELQNGQVVPKAEQTSQPHTQPVLHVSWNDDGTKVLTASCDKTAKIWDLNSNQAQQIAQHDQPVRTVHWIKSPTYTCAMTTSWDKTIKFWDTRTPNPILTLQLPDRAYSADVDYPMAVVATAGKKLAVYQLDGEPKEFKVYDSQLKFQSRVVSIFRDKKSNAPAGFALGGIEGRVAITLIQPSNTKDNFSFKCHRSNPTANTNPQEIFPVNDICFHPTFGTLATVGSDGRFSFWDKDVRTRLKTSEQMNMPITACALDATGKAFAYATSYDWSQGHECFNKDTMKPAIYIRDCFEDFRPNSRK